MAAPLVRIGILEVDLQTGDVMGAGVRRRLVGQPLAILTLLLERPGELVSREELRQRLWPEGKFVDFEHGLNAAVAKLREALGDSAERPAYVETIPRRGYRLVATVQGAGGFPGGGAVTEPPPADRVARRPVPLALLFAAVAAACGLAAILIRVEVSRVVARGARAPSGPEERLGTRPAESGAWAAYRRGRFFNEKERVWSNRKARESLMEAVAKDPLWAPAWAALAEVETFGTPPRDALPRAKAAALRAVALDPNLAEAHSALGTALTYGDRNWTGAESAFRRALVLEPNAAGTHLRYGLLLGILGRFDESLAHGRHAAELEPLSPNVLADLGRLYVFARRDDEAVQALGRALELDPDHFWALSFLGALHEARGRRQEAMEQWRRLAAVSGVDPRTIAAVEAVYEREGYEAALRRWLFSAPGVREREGEAFRRTSPRRLILLGERDEALRALARLYDAHGRDLVYLKVDPAFDSLRGDPRFDALVKSVGL